MKIELTLEHCELELALRDYVKKDDRFSKEPPEEVWLREVRVNEGGKATVILEVGTPF